MSTTRPFILHILVADGDPVGVRVMVGLKNRVLAAIREQLEFNCVQHGN